MFPDVPGQPTDGQLPERFQRHTTIHSGRSYIDASSLAVHRISPRWNGLPITLGVSLPTLLHTPSMCLQSVTSFSDWQVYLIIGLALAAVLWLAGDYLGNGEDDIDLGDDIPELF